MRVCFQNDTFSIVESSDGYSIILANGTKKGSNFTNQNDALDYASLIGLW